MKKLSIISKKNQNEVDNAVALTMDTLVEMWPEATVAYSENSQYGAAVYIDLGAEYDEYVELEIYRTDSNAVLAWPTMYTGENTELAATDGTMCNIQ